MTCPIESRSCLYILIRSEVGSPDFTTRHGLKSESGGGGNVLSMASGLVMSSPKPGGSLSSYIPFGLGSDVSIVILLG